MAGFTTEGVPTVFVPAASITLIWHCDNEDEHEEIADGDTVEARQSLSDVPHVGTAICPECGEDMELHGTEVAL